MNLSISINNRRIGENFPPYIVAEMSANHNGNINNAYKIIDMAKNSGADAIKLQTYSPETLTIDSNLPEFLIKDGLWSGQSLYELYKNAFMPWDWHQPLFEYAKNKNITIFSSPFDRTAVDLLEDLNSPAYKIASFELIDLPLIKYVAQTGKPMIMSTGMANDQEIEEAIQIARDGGCNDIAILYCVSAYPASPSDFNLRTIVDMRKRYGIVTGLSDHTVDNITAITSIGLGASIIEKHVTLDRNAGGSDDSFSLEEEGLNELCFSAKSAWNALGKVDYGVKSVERGNIKFRRSLYFVENIEKNQLITKEHVKSIRPGYGLHPREINKIIGKKVKESLVRGTAVKRSHIDWT